MTSDLTPKQTYDASPMFGADPIFPGSPKSNAGRSDDFGPNPGDPGFIMPVADTFWLLLGTLLLYGLLRLRRSVRSAETNE